MHLLSLTGLFPYLVLTSHAFTFYFTSTPTQCANLTVEWTGGQAPFTLLLVPVGHLNPETRTIIQKDVPSGTSISFVLDFPAQSQFVAVLNDASGIGAGGTSAITTVASSSDSSCLSTTQSHPKFFLFLPDDIGQCEPVEISWGSEAEKLVDILGLIPGGESFEIANVIDTSTSLQWTADLRSGTQIVFVAGDRGGLGTGGSSDVMNISEGNDDNCINDTSPSSTNGPAAGGVSSTTQSQGGSPTSGSDGGAGTNGGSIPILTTDNVGSTVTIGGTITTDGSGSTYIVIGSTGLVTTTDNSGSTTIIAGPAGPITTTDNAGSTVTLGGAGSTGGSFPGSSNSGFPGSGGGTVTGPPNNINENGRHDNLSLILGIVFGLLGLGLLISGIILYRQRQQRRSGPYRNLESGRSAAGRPHPWVTALTRGAHIRGGAGSSVDTLPSMYQTEPFILPSEHEPYIIPPQEPLLAQRQRPSLAARTSSMQNLIGHGPFTRDAFGGTLAGVHGPDRKESIGPHGRPPSRTPSGRVTTRRVGLPPPLASDPPTRVTRDSEDFSPEPEEMSPNPFDDDVIEIPPTYTSVRRASRSNDREPWQPTRAQLSRSNASRHSRRSVLSDVASASHAQES
ncbi:hypothetical protein ACEPAG_6151 [Sanghuangporus baumii]